ncbi:MAG: 4-hydroxy-tetrahydrodipicolinate reductase [Abditibacteriota bacterium]|nr:4-hydroxy-tetrahydrodipicolinate reductase [Abditibacteriota bacterium]
MIKVAVLGACGRMGSQVVDTVINDPECELAGACDIAAPGKELGGVTVCGSLEELLAGCSPDVAVDFAKPFKMKNIRLLMEKGVAPVIGTTGQTEQEIKEMKALAESTGVSCFLIPNFAIGAVLMMKYAAEIAKYMPDVEIIELHHDKKTDAPSGTALKTAKLIAESRKAAGAEPDLPLGSYSDPARGYSEIDRIPIHSVRLKGFVAHQEVIFGGQGQTLTIRHDSIDRTSFMPGVLMCIKAAGKKPGFVYGLENLL